MHISQLLSHTPPLCRCHEQFTQDLGRHLFFCRASSAWRLSLLFNQLNMLSFSPTFPVAWAALKFFTISVNVNCKCNTLANYSLYPITRFNRERGIKKNYQCSLQGEADGGDQPVGTLSHLLSLMPLQCGGSDGFHRGRKDPAEKSLTLCKGILKWLIFCGYCTCHILPSTSFLSR